MAKQYKYLYGPVFSRRLGRSLGVDIIPPKICTLDCVYCQLGKSSRKTVERKEYLPVAEVLAELEDRLARGLEADYITIAGSGEPTLNSRLGKLVTGIREITDIPVAVLTNGTLLDLSDVRADCAKADVVMPSLDAPDARTFEAINRPHDDISIERLISGLCSFRREFTGRIWLEVFIVEGLNTSDEQISALKSLIQRICPDRIHLNTAVRPTAEAHIAPASASVLREIAARLGPSCQIVAAVPDYETAPGMQTSPERVLSVLKRRPCSIDQLCAGLQIGAEEASKWLEYLRQAGTVEPFDHHGRTFFRAR